MQIEQSAEISPGEWDAAVEDSDDAWMFHTTKWIELTARVWPLENRYFLAREGRRMLGGFPLQVAPGGRRPWIRPLAYSIKMGTGGPFVIREVSPKIRKRVLAALSEAVLDLARERRLAGVECMLPPLAANNMANTRGVNPLVLLGWEDVSTLTRIVDLSLPQADLEAAVPDARRKMRRARDRGYTVARGDWSELLDEYYAVHTQTYRRTGVTPHPKSYFEGIARGFSAGQNALLWVCRSAEGEPVAFHNSARFKQGAVYWTGCSQSDHAQAGVNYLLFWHAILGAKEDGYKYYDVGEAFPNSPDPKLGGLTQFKSKFGGDLYRFYRGRVSLSGNRTGGTSGAWWPWRKKGGQTQ